MSDALPADIFAEPDHVDPDTLRNLGPLAPDRAFRTIEFRIRVDVHDDGSWSYEQDTALRIAGRDGLFHHTDRNRLRRVAEPTPNPLMRGRG